MIAFSDADHRRESFILGGWNLADDDIPRRPEPDPLASAQARRYWKHTAPTTSTQPEPQTSRA